MRRIATAAATTAALLLLPATAVAAESASVAGGVLTYTSGAGTVDVVTVFDGAAGAHRLSETATPAGIVGTGCVYAALYTVECSGATSASLSSLDGDDTIVVTAALPSTLDGGDGADTLTGGPAADTIRGGDGADTIDARGGGVDTVDCGPGVDSVQADAADVLSNCADAPKPPVDPVEPVEHVRPAGDPVLPADPPADPAPPVKLPDPLVPPKLDVPSPVTLDTPEEIRVGSSGVATFDLACAASELAGCRGSVYLDPAPQGKKGKPRAFAARRGRYGASRFAIPAGGKARVRMTLSNSARQALGLRRGRRARAARRGRPVKAVVTVSQQGKKPVKTKVKLKP